MDLVGFLRARLDEDRDFADVLAQEYAQMGPVIEGVTANKLHTLMRYTAMCLLREAEVKRKIMTRCENVLTAFRDPKNGLWDDVNRRERTHASATLYDLAAVYSDHLDYRQEWKP